MYNSVKFKIRIFIFYKQNEYNINLNIVKQISMVIYT